MFRQVSRGVQFPEWRREQQLPEQRRELLAFGAIERAEQPLLVLEVVDDRRVDELAALVRQGDEATTPVRRVRQALDEAHLLQAVAAPQRRVSG